MLDLFTKQPLDRARLQRRARHALAELGHYQHLYYESHRIENLFARLKAFRRIATRYEKLHATFAAMLALACILIWLKLRFPFLPNSP